MEQEGIQLPRVEEDRQSGKAKAQLDSTNTRSPAKSSLSSMAVEKVATDPPKQVEILIDHLHRLATMRRRKQSDFAQSALWAAIATAASGIYGWIDITSLKPNQPVR